MFAHRRTQTNRPGSNIGRCRSDDRFARIFTRWPNQEVVSLAELVDLVNARQPPAFQMHVLR